MIPLLLVAALSSQGQAPATGQHTIVAGTVISARTLEPVPDARVSLVELGREVRTSEAGRFIFLDVPPGSYTLSVSTVGFIFVRRAVVATADTPLDLALPLAEGTDTHREVVTVTASAAPELGSSSVELNSAELQVLRGVAADDPMRAMQALPGVATGDDFQAEFSVRGSAFRQVGLVIDGTATSLLFHAVRGMEDTGSIAMINSDVLSGASLSAGTHPQRHGDWLGATLEFNLREGTRDRKAFRAAISGTSASTVFEGPVGHARRGSWLVSLRKSYVGWLVRKIDPGIESTLGFTDGQVKVAYDVSPRQQLQFLMIVGDATYQTPTATGANQVHESHTRSTLVSGAWRYTRHNMLVSQRVSFATNVFHNTGSRGQQQADGDIESLVWRADTGLALTDAWTLDAGAKANYDSLAQTFRDFSTQGGVIRLRRDQQIDDTRVIGSGWAGLTRRVHDGGLGAGLRLSADSRTHRTVVSPWVMAERRLGTVTFSGGAGRVHQFPTLEHLGQGLEPLLPEQAWTSDVALGRQLTNGLRAKVALFYRQESNILRAVGEDRLADGALVAETPFPIVASRLTGSARGVDLLLERRANTGLTGWAGYSWAHTRHRDRSTGEVFDGDFDQRHTLNVFVEQRLSYRMKVNAKFRYGSNFPLVGYFEGTPDDLHLSSTRNAVRLPVYARLDLSGSRTFTLERTRLTLFIELINVTARRNLGPANGSIRSNFVAEDYFQRLIPFLPSAGILAEF